MAQCHNNVVCSWGRDYTFLCQDPYQLNQHKGVQWLVRRNYIKDDGKITVWLCVEHNAQLLFQRIKTEVRN